jgi:hypothetical protein
MAHFIAAINCTALGVARDKAEAYTTDPETLEILTHQAAPMELKEIRDTLSDISKRLETDEYEGLDPTTSDYGRRRSIMFLMDVIDEALPQEEETPNPEDVASSLLDHLGFDVDDKLES